MEGNMFLPEACCVSTVHVEPMQSFPPADSVMRDKDGLS